VKAKPSRRANARKPLPAKVRVAALARDKSAPKLVTKKAHAVKQPTAKAEHVQAPSRGAAIKSASLKAEPGNGAPTKALATKVLAIKAAPAKPAPVKALAAKPALESVRTKAAPVKPTAARVAPIKPPPAAAVAPQPKKPARKSIKEAAGVSTDAVARRTGKSWDDWFEVLDSAGAATLDQRGVVAILAQKHGIGPWWQQMIAVGYESVRAKSDRPPASDGFRINTSCMLDAPLPRVFRLWNDAGERARWLADDRFVVRGATADKSIRARWGKGTSHVAVSFSEKSGRTQVSVDHHQIESSAAAEQMKAYWAKKLGLLEALAPRR
jgi:hypothetical protein